MKNFILAARPKTLLAGVVPPIVTFVYFQTHRQEKQWIYLFLCVFGALFIQLATNFFNDLIDHQKGADLERVGPTRVSASGLVDMATLKSWAYACLLIAAACGIPLIIRAGWPVFILGAVSLYLTFGYTGGKVSLAYRGLGELFVFLFFGLFSVMGSYYIYAQTLDFKVFILASIFGCLNITFIGINNLRDRETDARVGKRTLATRFSREVYQGLVVSSIFLPYVLLHFFKTYELIYFTFLGTIPALKLTAITLRARGPELNEGLKFSGIHLIIFSLILSTVFVYESTL